VTSRPNRWGHEGSWRSKTKVSKKHRAGTRDRTEKSLCCLQVEVEKPYSRQNPRIGRRGTGVAADHCFLVRLCCSLVAERASALLPPLELGFYRLPRRRSAVGSNLCQIVGHFAILLLRWWSRCALAERKGVNWGDVLSECLSNWHLRARGGGYRIMAGRTNSTDSRHGEILSRWLSGTVFRLGRKQSPYLDLRTRTSQRARFASIPS